MLPDFLTIADLSFINLFCTILLSISFTPVKWAAITGIVSIFSGLIFYFLRKEKKLASEKKLLEEKISIRTFELMKQKFELVEKNREVRRRNEEFTDSLNYAQRLQTAILPEKNSIQQSFPDSFVLYLPKDIVSGDFYFFTEHEGKHIFAAADCTGHGVSGALMSMIGSSVLTRIIKRGILNPDEILNQLNNGLNELLRQSQSESHDGMDVCLCVYDPQTNTLQYAGANRPLWLIRNNELLSFKQDKFSIGSASKPYSSQSIPIQKDDVIYLFSDGYADQFGGMLGKKLMTKNLKEILIEINYMTMKEQGRFLKTYLQKYRGDLEQVDDILVIGIRF